MSRIRIKNFGPIKDGFTENDGWIDVKKVTVFIGNQGSGKSTVAKLISTFAWIEKDLFRSDGATLKYRRQERFFKKRLEYHRIDSYLQKNTEIYYEGGAYDISYQSGNNLDITKRDKIQYDLPKITYFPAERNFVSSVKKSKGDLNLKLWSQSLQEFKETLQEAKEQLREKEKMQLPIGNVELEYSKLNDILYVKGGDFKVQLSDSASGFQSFVPLYVVARYATKLLKSEQEMNEQQRETFKKDSAKILNDAAYTEEQKRILLSNLAAQFNIKRTLNIIEEPEQNLFPTSQQQMIYNLLEFNNSAKANELIITTHSPYIIGYITLAIKANELYQNAKNDNVIQKISKIVPRKSSISSDNIVIYELIENDGTIRKLDDYKGIPSSKNFLNKELAEKNELYSQLLDIQDLCQ